MAIVNLPTGAHLVSSDMSSVSLSTHFSGRKNLTSTPPPPNEKGADMSDKDLNWSNASSVSWGGDRVVRHMFVRRSVDQFV